LNTSPKTGAAQRLKFGRYVVLKLLGEGAMGKVFLAEDPVLRRQVAIKVISVDRRLDEKTRRDFLGRFSQEARLSAQLSHQSIVSVFDAGEENGVPWIAFQYVDGVALDAILKKNGKLPLKWVVHIALDIASALHQAHGLHVVHRDIKPANIIMDRRTGTAKLSDFGIAKVPWTSLTGEGDAMGSPGYMSPEQIEGSSLDGRSDLFSLGIVIYEMITGRHPFLRDTVAATAMATVSGRYAAPHELAKGVPAVLENIITQCLAPDREKRTASAARLIEQLQSLVPSRSTTFRAAALAGENRPFVLNWLRRISSAPEMVAGKMREAISGARWAEVARIAGRAVAALFAYIFSGAVSLITPLFGYNRKAAARAAAAGCMVLIAAAGIVLWPARHGARNATLYIPYGNLDKEAIRLADDFRVQFAAGNLVASLLCADGFSTDDAIEAALGDFFRGLLETRKKNYGDARACFEKAARRPEGTSLIDHNRRYMIERLFPALESERAPDDLVLLLSRSFSAADEPRIRNALEDPRYWVRWNALRICQSSGRPVDLMKVFLLDLKYGDNARVRARAVQDLAELNDRRAIPALKQLARDGRSDPLVADAAKKALEETFGVK